VFCACSFEGVVLTFCANLQVAAKKKEKKQTKINLLVSPGAALQVLQEHLETSWNRNVTPLKSVNIFLTHHDKQVPVGKMSRAMLERIVDCSKHDLSTYKAKIKDEVRVEAGLPVFDVVLLEAGSDGRCAGFVPNMGAIVNTGNGEEVVILLDKKKDGIEGYSISLGVLWNATRLLVLATGIDKQDVVALGLGKTQEGRITSTAP